MYVRYTVDGCTEFGRLLFSDAVFSLDVQSEPPGTEGIVQEDLHKGLPTDSFKGGFRKCGKCFVFFVFFYWKDTCDMYIFPLVIVVCQSVSC